MPIAPPVHTPSAETTNDWITPRSLIERLGPFTLDPCACTPQPWPCARTQYTEADDGLHLPWFGLVWMNPPYGRRVGRWLRKMAEHNRGIALLFARTDTRPFFEYVWPRASSLLFLRGRLTFHYPDGSVSPDGHNSGGPSVLIGYGREARQRLQAAKDLGAFVPLTRGR